MIRVLIVGFGSIGRRHCGNVRAIETSAHITLLRHDRRKATVRSGADVVVYTLDEALDARPDVAFICGPSALHAEVAVPLAQAGVHLFIEKPLALDASSARRIVAACRTAGRLLIVGYNLRFCVSLSALRDAAHAGRVGRIMSGRAEVGQYLPEWRTGDYRITNSARADLGGGIVLELSHEIDYMRWMLGEVRSVDALVEQLSDLEIDVPDTADLLLSCAGRRVANIHMDMTQRNATRRCQLVGTAGTLSWDGVAGETQLYRPESGWTTLVAAGSQDRNAMYVAEAAHVLACVRGEETPFVDGDTGTRIVELAEAVLVAAREGRRVNV